MLGHTTGLKPAPLAARQHALPCIRVAQFSSRRVICRARPDTKQRQPNFTTSSAPSLDNNPAPAEAATPSNTTSSSGAPPVTQPPPPAAAAAVTSAVTTDPWLPLRAAWKRVIRELSSLPRAIAIMAAIAVASGLGTIIPQNKDFDYYLTNYPEGPDAVLGFLSWQVLLGLQLDHVYSAWWFYALLALLGASLIACTASTQWPVAKVAQRWRFPATPAGLQRLGPKTAVLPHARLADLGAALHNKGYQVFRKEGALYAFKGLAGRLGPIGVHAALILSLGGTAYSGVAGWKGAVMVPEGQGFLVAERIRPASSISSLPEGAKGVLQVNDFTIDTRPDGSVAQFYSDLSLTDFQGRELTRKTISVNDPFRYGGVTMYQTDWSLAAVTIRVLPPPTATSSTPSGTSASASGASGAPVDAAAEAALLDDLQAEAQASGAGDSSTLGSRTTTTTSSSSSGAGASSSSSSSSGSRGKEVLDGRSFNLPMASLEGKPGVPVGSKLWATFLPLEVPKQDGSAPRGISMIAGNLDTVTLYDSSGQFAGVRRPGSGKPITVDGLTFVVEDIVGSTGLEIKADPGVPWVYAGFGGLMITTLVSYVSHSQVWALQEGSSVYVAGKTNRAKVTFEQELDDVMDSVPEVQPQQQAGAAASS